MKSPPPFIFWNREQVARPKLYLNYFFKELTRFGYASYSLCPFYQERLATLFPRIPKTEQKILPVNTTQDFLPIRFEGVHPIQIITHQTNNQEIKYTIL